MKNILIVDDDPNLLQSLKTALGKNLDVTTCLTVERAISKLISRKFDIILSDHILAGGMDGMQLMKIIDDVTPRIPFILMSGVGDHDQKASFAQEQGALYISKPANMQQILDIIEKAMSPSESQILKKEASIFSSINNAQYPKQSIANNDDPKTPAVISIPTLLASNYFFNMISISPKMTELFQYIQQIANTNTTVLIQGESGTGKELIAHAIHTASDRGKRGAPFIAINCSVLSENLLENELFGHIRGAFTGAIQYKKGLFQEADGGTLFLDEIGDMPPSVQTKLLRVLQEKEFKPLGSNEIVRIDVRVIAATNVNLYEAVIERKFRADLYYRLAVIKIFVPPLRERIEDIPVLVAHFIQKYSQENHKKIAGIESYAMEKLQQQQWLGNVRELENTIERAIALAQGPILCYIDIFDQYFEHSTQEVSANNMPLPTVSNNEQPQIRPADCMQIKSLKSEIDENVRLALSQALQRAHNNRSLAAKMLGITRPCLYYKLKKYKLWLPKFPENSL